MISKIPFLEVGAAYSELEQELDAAYRRVSRSGWFILGAEVTAFEQEFAKYLGAGHCIGVGTGLEALHLVLRGMDIGPGDEVIVPANTYIATWLAVTYDPPRSAQPAHRPAPCGAASRVRLPGDPGVFWETHAVSAYSGIMKVLS